MTGLMTLLGLVLTIQRSAAVRLLARMSLVPLWALGLLMVLFPAGMVPDGPISLPTGSGGALAPQDSTGVLLFGIFLLATAAYFTWRLLRSTRR